MSRHLRRATAAAVLALGILTGAPAVAAADELCTRHPDACEAPAPVYGTDHGTTTSGSAAVTTCVWFVCWTPR
jgi:hypothetical protein